MSNVVSNVMVLLILGFITAYTKGYQVQVIVGGSYISAYLFSWAINFMNVATILLAVEYGWASLIPLGIGGSTGVVTAMYAYRNRKTK